MQFSNLKTSAPSKNARCEIQSLDANDTIAIRRKRLQNRTARRLENDDTCFLFPYQSSIAVFENSTTTIIQNSTMEYIEPTRTSSSGFPSNKDSQNTADTLFWRGRDDRADLWWTARPHRSFSLRVFRRRSFFYTQIKRYHSGGSGL